jgi:hypothetical protein
LPNPTNDFPFSIFIEQVFLVAFLFGILVWIGKMNYLRPAKVYGFILLWLVVTTVAAANNRLSNFAGFPPLFFIFMMIQLVFLGWLIFFSSFKEQLLQIKQIHLIYTQTFRIAVELILAQLATVSLFPIELTYHGINFDIISGLLALPIGFCVAIFGENKMKRGILAFNVIGLILLANIVLHVVLALPTPLQKFYFGVEPRIVGVFPMQWLPYFLVPTALGLHLLSLRKIWKHN